MENLAKLLRGCGVVLAASAVAGCGLWYIKQRLPERVPEEKRWYVAKNLTQGTVLTVLAPVGVSIVHGGVLRDEWPAASIAVCAIAYAATDVAALFLVPGMMKSTVAHHIAVWITSGTLVGTQGAVTASPAGRAAVVYASASAVAGCVNVYLGARFLTDKGSRVMRWAAAFCATVYGLTLAVNVPAQVWLTLVSPKEPQRITLAWVAATTLLLYDDGILMGHLVSAARAKDLDNKTTTNKTMTD